MTTMAAGDVDDAFTRARRLGERPAQAERRRFALAKAIASRLQFADAAVDGRRSDFAIRARLARSFERAARA